MLSPRAVLMMGLIEGSTVDGKTVVDDSPESLSLVSVS